MRKKRIIANSFLSLLLISFFINVFSCASLAANNGIISINDVENVFIYDKDNIIKDNVEKTLNNLLVELESKTKAEFAVISVPSLNNLTIEEYANKLFNNIGIGKKGKDNGILLLISKSDNKVRLEIGRGLEGCLNDAKCGRILDNYFVPYRNTNNYTEAVKLTVNAVLNVVSEEYDVTISGVEKVDIEEEKNPLPIWFIIMLIIILVLLEIGAGGSSGGTGNHYRGSSGGFSSRGGGFGRGISGGAGASR